MTKEYTYDILSSNSLSAVFKSTGSFVVRLQKKRAKMVLKYIELSQLLTGQDEKERSTLFVFVSLIRSVCLTIRMASFHGKLFQIFIFYFNDQPDYMVENEKDEDGRSTIRFFIADKSKAH